MLVEDLVEEHANEIFTDAIKLANKDVDLARTYFAISWGMNRYLERMDFMTLCHRHLVVTGLTEYGARKFEERKYKSAMKIVSVIVGINEYEKQKAFADDLRRVGVNVLGEIDFR